MSSQNSKRDLRIMVDTSTWMQEHAEPVLRQHFAPIVRESGRKLAVPVNVVEEINKHVRSVDAAVRERAKRAARLFRALQSDGLVDVFGGSEETFTDNVIQMVIVRFAEKYHFCLLTQDRKLAADTLRLELRKSVRGKSVVAFRVGDAGTLDIWDLDNDHPDGASWRTVEPAANAAAGAVRAPAPQTPVGFRLRTGAPRSLHEKLPVAFPVKAGARLLDDSGATILLVEQIGSGGQGIVYSTNLDLVCKIYEPSALTVATRDKIRLMLQHPVRQPGICWPCAAVRNHQGEFVGYLMKRAHGKELQKTVFIKPLLEQNFPKWKRRELVRLTIDILESISTLHRHGVLLGDINPRNFLIGERGAYLVDTDSYQIEDFACPVGTATFSAPELLGQSFATVLRSFSQEYFAVATLVFMMVMPGKPPYSHTGGGDPAENVRRRHFPYGLAQKKAQGVPAGPWRYMWSHLPFYLKDAFHDVFVDGERPPTEQWLAVMNRYLSDLERGHVSDEVFPVTFKKLRRTDVVSKGGTWQVCAECASEFGHFESKAVTLCPDCRSREIEMKCCLCGEVELIARRYEDTPICSECRARSYLVRCKNCSADFDMPATERAFFKKRPQLKLPTRCPACRAARRAADATGTPGGGTAANERTAWTHLTRHARDPW